MATFMDVHHDMKGITADQLREAHKADLAIEGEEGVHFERAWADPASGTVYCLSEAPSAEAVQRVHTRTGHPAAEIHPVPLSVT
ncbi:SCO4226 family nickel-binding protein [Streptomyces sp. NPDC089919]|uniref:SCO4226 family nickel-binding protein n=1 Tax=Streptomyces sp. NPDC089919 TaxID=3155188 RepID=UPI003420621E